jgi:hypothetical protein
MQDSDWQDHHGSHQGLLTAPGDPLPEWPGLDAIIVPTIRHPASLAEAARLAQILNCTLVTLHSGGATKATWALQTLPADVDLLAIDVTPPPPLLRLPPWETSRLLNRTVFARRTDLSAKRNLALMLSRMLDWSRVLFLDDDITVPNLEDIKRAICLLETHNAVGLHVGGFPDHSVVCHAYRLAGGHQQSFIGGGALAVKTECCNSFFPDIYNEDWLFMLDRDGRLQPVTCAGEVRQASFDPFRTADRARTEEFGDVLAEGAYWLLDQGQPVSRADYHHWATFLAKRRKFIERVLDMVRRHDLEWSEKQRIVAALKVSMSQLERITSDLCERYLEVWAADREAWQRHLSGLPTGQERQQAVNLLSARGAPLLTRFLTKDRVGNRARLPLGTALRSPS